MSDFLRKHLARIGRRNGIAILAGLVAIGGVLGFQVWQRDSLPDGAAFKVGNHVVMAKDVERRSAVLRALYGVEIPTEAEKKAQFFKDAAQSMALGLVIEDGAAAMGVSVPERDAKQALAEYVVKYFGEGVTGRDAFVAAMAGQGTSEADVLAEVRRHLLLNALFTKQTETVPTPTADEVRAAFTERKCLLDTPELRQISNIVVASQEEAVEVRGLLDAGAGFAETARDRSLDPGTAEEGGELGQVAAEELEDEYAAAAFASGQGEVFGPVKSSHGWNIGVVTAISPAEEASFEQVQSDLALLLQYERRADVWRDWLVSQLRDSGVVYAERFEPSNPLGLPESVSDPNGAEMPADACAKQE